MRIGPYHLSDPPSQGEILNVYQARDTERECRVVIKMLQPHLRDDAALVTRFQREAERLVGLGHSKIAPMRLEQAGTEGSCLVTDVPPGLSLEQRLAGQGALEVDDVLSIVSQVAEALDYAHEQGVLHQDLRPTNIYLDDKATVLTNFFLLEAVGATPAYMAPEQFDETSAEATDPRTDVYALGVVVYELLTGVLPFKGTASEVATAHLTQRPTLPRVHNPDLPPSLDAILLKALTKQPQNRYRTASELAEVLHEAVRVAKTRRMADMGQLNRLADVQGEAAYESSFLDSVAGLPTWAWMGVGIFLIVVICAVILLVTG